MKVWENNSIFSICEFALNKALNKVEEIHKSRAELY